MHTKTHDAIPAASAGGSLVSSSSSQLVGPGWAPRTTTNFLHKLTIHMLFTLFLRRSSRILLLAPFIYITAMVLYIGGSAMELPARFQTCVHIPGSYYRSDEVFNNLWPAMQQTNASISYGVLQAWEYPKEGAGFRPCVHHLHHDSIEGLPESNGYILVEANGGLNQQRSTICNAVAVAKLMNSTLIIPHFHFNSVWKDPSVFGDIFDEDHFISSLAHQVRILRELPKEVMVRFENISMIPRVKVRAWSLPRFYLETALPALKQHGVIRFTPFANRLAYDGIPKRIQKLRCFTNFEALQFASPIAATGQLLVKRMAAKSANSNGNYVAIHLRYEQDMVAFSRCVYEGDHEEKVRLDNARERGWRGKFNRTGRVQQTPEEIRRDGKCPLTPVEVGIMLRGMGFRNTTPIYLAAGKIYNEEESMEPLHRMFPYLETKQTLLSPEEYAPFEGYSSRLAAIDYTVCLHSEVFVTSQGGNFPQIMMGHRRFLNKGHPKTINPDKRRLVKLLDNPQITFRKADLETSDDVRSLKRKSMSVNEEGVTTVPIVTVDLGSLSRDQKRELRKKLKLNLDQVKSIAAKIDVRQDIVVPEGGALGTPGGSQGKEKRTPKANQLYLNSEFVSGKDKMPPPGKLKSKGTTPEAARARRMGDILKQCSTLLKKMMSHKHAWVFNEPVDAEKLGLHDYHKVISNPMDLGTIKERIANGYYFSPTSFADDVKLTFANAMTYNPQGHDVYVMAQVLAGLFNDRWKDIARKLEEEKLKIKVEEETLALDDTIAMGQANPLQDIQEHLKRVETQIQSLAKSSSRPSPAVRPSLAHGGKQRPEFVQKRPMTFEEKRELSINLEKLPGDKLERIVQIIKKRNPDVGQNEDEIEVDIDSFDNETLWELDRFITNCMKSRGKKAKKATQKAQQGFSEANQVHYFCPIIVIPLGGEGGEEDVDIDDDLAPAKFAPVAIDKDGGGEAGGTKSSSSDSDSSDTGSSSSDSDSGSTSGSETEAEDAQSAGAGSKTAHEKVWFVSSGDEVIAKDTPLERQVSPNKLLRAALLRGRFADTILKAQEKTLPVDKNEKVDPEKLRKDREELERRQKEEKARLQAEAIAAKEEAARKERCLRELEREAARRALQQMERTVEIDESSEILKNLERLRSIPIEQLAGSAGEEGSPNDGPSDVLPTYSLQGGNPLEQLGLFMKDDEDEDDHQGDHEDSHEVPMKMEVDKAEGKPTNMNVDVEEGEID
ncbi:unnamed protein product [Sphagnum jensenii]|uniref:O-fucosyltransferase family protein n=1 Tax=Sphagnum jensenii TaxID=128206 RepID=A0ABP0X291_9BRYO